MTHRPFIFRTITVLLFFLFSCNGFHEATEPVDAPLSANAHADSVMKALAEFKEDLGKPQKGDWLETVKEQHQTFDAYVNSKPVRPDAKRNKIYVQPIGEFDSLRAKIIDDAVEYLHEYFGLEVKLNKAVPSSVIPSDKTRMNHGEKQVITGYILNSLLAPSLPEDAVVSIAFTTFDLYPEESWNFVFGQASIKKRVGVWSLARFGDPYADKDAYLKCLVHTLKTASHETGHMFGIEHCVNGRCNMNGSMSLQESATRPLWLCPECLCKLCWDLGQDEKEHLKRLKTFWIKRNEPLMVDVYGRMIKALN